MDLNSIETINVDALDGADTVTVNDLTGTDASQVNIDLAGINGAPDADSDTVVINAHQRRRRDHDHHQQRRGDGDRVWPPTVTISDFDANDRISSSTVSAATTSSRRPG